MPQKGLDEYAYVTGLFAAGIEWLVHTKLILKARSEPSLLAVVRATVRRVLVEVKTLEMGVRVA